MCVNPSTKYRLAMSPAGGGGGATSRRSARLRAGKPEGLHGAVADPHVQRE